jgi:hypothetical protein
MTEVWSLVLMLSQTVLTQSASENMLLGIWSKQHPLIDHFHKSHISQTKSHDHKISELCDKISHFPPL